MFIGHFGVAFGVKRAEPQIKLGTAVLATTFLDVAWPVLVATGIESVRIEPGATAFTPLVFERYPYSHSLALAAVWAALFAWVYRRRGGSPRAAAWLGAVVVSHWFLDLIVHAPDLPLVPGLDVRLGFGLWSSVPGTLVVEGLLFAGGLWLYLSATRARDRIGTWGLWGLVALLLASYAGAAAGPPPNVAAITIADLVGTAITIVWAYWVDRHREAVVLS